MKHLITTAALATALGSFGATAAAVPGTSTMTANIQDDNGPITGAISLRIRVFDADSGGSMIWEDSHTVTADNGRVFVTLGGGGGGALDDSVFDGGERWFELVVNGNPLSPRLRVGVVPYAVRASSADSADHAISADSATSASSAANADKLGGLGASSFQRRVDQSCSAGSSIRSISATGAVTCEPDTDTNTTYSAGSGLTANGTQFNVDTSTVQSRVTGSCQTGSSIRAIAANGTVTCQTDTAGSGDITGVTTSATSGIDGGCTSDTCSLSVDSTELNGSTPVDDYVSSGTVLASTGWVTIATITVSHPKAGYVALTGSASAYCSNCNSNNPLADCRIGWTTSSTGTPTQLAQGRSVWMGSPGISYANPTINTRFSVSAGTSTSFYLRAKPSSATDSCGFNYRSAVGVFQPN